MALQLPQGLLKVLRNAENQVKDRYAGPVLFGSEQQTEDGATVADLARDVGEMVYGCLRFPEIMRHSLEISVERVAAGEIKDFQESGELLLRLFDAIVQHMKGMQEWAGKLREQGHLVAHATELGEAIKELSTLRDEFADRWPWIDKNVIDEATAEYERGESSTLDEAFAEIAGVDQETWRRRVEERNRQGDAGAVEGG